MICWLHISSDNEIERYNRIDVSLWLALNSRDDQVLEGKR